MRNVTAYVQRLQDLLGDVVQNAAADTHFIQRQRKITPLAWLLATVFGWLHNKHGTDNLPILVPASHPVPTELARTRCWEAHKNVWSSGTNSADKGHGGVLTGCAGGAHEPLYFAHFIYLNGKVVCTKLFLV